MAETEGRSLWPSLLDSACQSFSCYKSSSPGCPDPQRTKLDKLNAVSALRSAI